MVCDTHDIRQITVPVVSDLSSAAVGDRVAICGAIYAARDAIMPRILSAVRDNSTDDIPMSIKGSAIMHTACSPSGFGPTSSNKEEIESAMGELSQAGVVLHIGKGAIKQETVDDISKYGALYIVVPPVSALLQSSLLSKKLIGFEEEGMEALYELTVKDMPGVIAAARGVSIFQSGRICPEDIHQNNCHD